MKITARFYVASLTRRAHDPEAADIEFKPAYRGEENKAWAVATPSGEIKMYVANPSAVDFFAAALLNRSDLHLTFEIAEPAEQTT